MAESRNRLATETSPYLLQHADNPVHWWPWGEAALAEAKRTNRPILLSVGYAACHCFTSGARELRGAGSGGAHERAVRQHQGRPRRAARCRAIYMQALQVLGEPGGWPLTMFCTPAGEPFWGGTYFPHPARYGRPGFLDVLRGVSQAFRDKPDEVETNRAGLLQALQRKATGKAVEFKGDGPPVPLALLDQIAQRIAEECDQAWGGLGQAPKFPSPYLFEMLWRGWLRDRNNARLFQSVTVTLDRMCQGGIYDHLGGGFARYATDNEWLIPHFEKMLYDNAQLVDFHPGLAGDQESAVRHADRRDLRLGAARDGGGGWRFAATYDADSEGVEGKFYVWDEAEIDAVLGDEAAFFKQVYDVTAQGNWEHHTILHRNRAPALLSEAEEQRLTGLRAKLKAVRDKRIWPGWDDKVLADWNGLMIAALANAAAVFQRDDWLAAAECAWRFVMDQMRDEHGRLFHSWRIGKRLHRGTLDDYANMARASIALFEATGMARYLDEAKSLVSVLDRHFADDAAGGYFITADDAADLIVRTKHCHDNAAPAATHVARRVRALWVLAARYLARQAERQLRPSPASWRATFPADDPADGYETLQGATELVIVGDLARPIPKRYVVPSMCRAFPTRSSAALRQRCATRTSSRRRQGSGCGNRTLRLPWHSCRAPIVDAGLSRMR